jgi:hypothetical protein
MINHYSEENSSLKKDTEHLRKEVVMALLTGNTAANL